MSHPADVAQLVEHFTRNEGVPGSNPGVGLGRVLSCKNAPQIDARRLSSAPALVKAWRAGSNRVERCPGATNHAQRPQGHS